MARTRAAVTLSCWARHGFSLLGLVGPMALALSRPVSYPPSLQCPCLETTPSPHVKVQARDPASHGWTRVTVYRCSNASRSTDSPRPAPRVSRVCPCPAVAGSSCVTLPFLQLRFQAPPSRPDQAVHLPMQARRGGASGVAGGPRRGAAYSCVYSIFRNAGVRRAPGNRSCRSPATTPCVAPPEKALKNGREFTRIPALSSRNVASGRMRVELYLNCSRKGRE
jgi:hypothetical protein